MIENFKQKIVIDTEFSENTKDRFDNMSYKERYEFLNTFSLIESDINYSNRKKIGRLLEEEYLFRLVRNEDNFYDVVFFDVKNSEHIITDVVVDDDYDISVNVYTGTDALLFLNYTEAKIIGEYNLEKTLGCILNFTAETFIDNGRDCSSFVSKMKDRLSRILSEEEMNKVNRNFSNIGYLNEKVYYLVFDKRYNEDMELLYHKGLELWVYKKCDRKLVEG